MPLFQVKTQQVFGCRVMIKLIGRMGDVEVNGYYIQESHLVDADIKVTCGGIEMNQSRRRKRKTNGDHIIFSKVVTQGNSTV